LENVPRIAAPRNAHNFQAILERLLVLGYSFRHAVLDASDFGAPQARRRMFVLASLAGPPVMPVPTHGVGLSPKVTVRDAIYDLGGVPASRFADGSHHRPAHSNAYAIRIAGLKPGEEISDYGTSSMRL